MDYYNFCTLEATCVCIPDEKWEPESDDLDTDVERDWHNGIEDDGIGEKDQDRDESSSLCQALGNQLVPRQVVSEVGSRQGLPYAWKSVNWKNSMVKFD